MSLGKYEDIAAGHNDAWDGADRRHIASISDFPQEFTDRRISTGGVDTAQVLANLTPQQIISNNSIHAEAATGGQLVAVEGISADTRASRALYDGYIEQREAVKALDKIDGAELATVQESVRTWLDQNEGFTSGQKYDAYDKEHLMSKLYGLTDYLRLYHADKVSELELTTTESFVTSIFSMYEDREPNGAVSPDADGSFAFVVPMRCSRIDKDYGQEVEPAVPALRYVPNELRAQMLVGVPPFIIDTYKAGDDGKRGYLILAPVFTDMGLEMLDDGASLVDIQNAARTHIDNAVDFAQQRLGVTVAGLGAVLPSLTHYGNAVKNQNVLITNGHGGTAHLVKETAKKAIAEGWIANSEHPKIGVLGLGAIGASIADLAAEEFDPPIEIFDTNNRKRERTLANIQSKGREANVSLDAEALIRESDVVLSAIVGRIKLSEFKERPDLTNMVFVDDSQPGSFDPEEVRAHGGTVMWVIGEDTQGIVQRDGYDYGTMADGKRDLFGCEAEAASLYRYSQELKGRGMSDRVVDRILTKVAVKEAVTPQKARYIGALFNKYGIVPSAPQAFGRLIERPQA